MRAGLRRTIGFALAAGALALIVPSAAAQWGDFGWRWRAPRYRPAGQQDGTFSFCRLMFTSVRREPSGSGWTTDYPYADINFSIRLSELTKTPVSLVHKDQPNYWVVRLTDETLFDCPFIMASDIGTVGLSPEERDGLRTYLLKGGFLWVDDFWGVRAWEQWARQIAQVLPPAEYPIIDVPADHAIFKTLFQVSKVPQITNIGFWRSVGGKTTSERGAETAVPHLRMMTDSAGRIIVLMSHDTDIADAWEREGEDPGFFNQFSPDGYAIGINILLYAMTH